MATDTPGCRCKHTIIAWHTCMRICTRVHAPASDSDHTNATPRPHVAAKASAMQSFASSMKETWSAGDTCERACGHARVPLCVRALVRASSRACVHVVRVRVRACVRVLVRACVCSCVRARARAHTWACAFVRVLKRSLVRVCVLSCVRAVERNCACAFRTGHEDGCDGGDDGSDGNEGEAGSDGGSDDSDGPFSYGILVMAY